MKSTKAFTLSEPLLIEGGQQSNYTILPSGTTLYFDKSWDEGHQTYHVYFNFQGDFQSIPANPEIISPLWLRTVEREEVTKLMREYPLTKGELQEILKARKMTRSDLAQIVREWKDD